MPGLIDGCAVVHILKIFELYLTSPALLNVIGQFVCCFFILFVC